MIIRNYIECPACQAAIILRVGIARERQIVTVSCPSCHSTIRGETYEASDGLPRLSLPGISPIDPERAETEWHTVTTYGDLPSDPTRGEHSSFLAASALFGDYFIQYMRCLSTVRWFGDRVDPLEHAYGFYLGEKWDLLDSVMKRNFEELWPENPSILDRHTALHRILYLPVFSLDPEGYYPKSKHDTWSRTFKKEAEFARCAHSIIAKPEFTAANRRVSEQFLNLLRSNQEWTPAMTVVHLRAIGTPIPHGWQFPAGRIDSLRDAYRQNFEVSCQMLPLVIRMQNIAEGRDPEIIRDPTDTQGWRPRNLDRRDQVNNLNQYTRAKAVTKEAYLDRHTLLRYHWNAAFNRDVRNSIAHAEFDYTMHDGMISYKGREVPFTLSSRHSSSRYRF